MKILSPKRTDINQSPQSGRIIPEDENSKSKTNGYKPKSTKWTDHPRRMKILSPKMDGYKPKSTKWTDHPRRMKIIKSTKWMDKN